MSLGKQKHKVHKQWHAEVFTPPDVFRFLHITTTNLISFSWDWKEKQRKRHT